MQEMQISSLCREDPLEEEMPMHSSILAWEIPWTYEPNGLQSMGMQKSDTAERPGMKHEMEHFIYFNINLFILIGG